MKNKMISPLLIALVFIITLNFRLSVWVIPGYNFYDIKRILELALLAAICVLLLLSPNRRYAWLNTYSELPLLARWLFFAILIIGLLSCLFAPLIHMAVLELSLYLLLLYFTLFISAERQLWQTDLDKALITVITLAITVYSVTFFYVYIHSVIAQRPSRVFPGFVNVRFLAQFLIWTLPMALLPIYYLRQRNVVLRLLTFVIAVAWWVIAIANGAKGMFLALGIAAVVVGVIFGKRALKLAVIQATIIIASIVIAWLMFHTSPTEVLKSGVTTISSSTSSRIDLWLHTLQLIKSHPIFGVGPLNFSYYPNKIGAHPHNSLLLITVEWGIPAALISLALFLWGSFAWLRACRQMLQKSTSTSLQALAMVLTAAFFAGSFYSLVSGVVISPLSQIMLCIVIGWMLGLYQTIKGKTHHLYHSGLRQGLFIVLMLLALLGVAQGIFPAVLYLPQDEIRWYITRQFKAQFMPRFWLQGWLY